MCTGKTRFHLWGFMWFESAAARNQSCWTGECGEKPEGKGSAQRPQESELPNFKAMHFNDWFSSW